MFGVPYKRQPGSIAVVTVEKKFGVPNLLIIWGHQMDIHSLAFEVESIRRDDLQADNVADSQIW